MSNSNASDDAKRPTGDLHHLVHQFNQPLTAIGNYAQAGCHLIDQGIDNPARLRELFEKILQQSSRASALTRELGSALAALGQTSP